MEAETLTRTSLQEKIEIKLTRTSFARGMAGRKVEEDGIEGRRLLLECGGFG